MLMCSINEEDVTVASSANDGVIGRIDEYDFDTDNDFREFSGVPVSRACTIRPGRVVRGYLRLDISSMSDVSDFLVYISLFRIVVM